MCQQNSAIENNVFIWCSSHVNRHTLIDLELCIQWIHNESFSKRIRFKTDIVPIWNFQINRICLNSNCKRLKSLVLFCFLSFLSLYFASQHTLSHLLSLSFYLSKIFITLVQYSTINCAIYSIHTYCCYLCIHTLTICFVIFLCISFH